MINLTVMADFEDYDREWATLGGEELSTIYQNKIMDKIYSIEFKSNSSYK